MRARGPPATQAERAARRGDNTAGFPGTGSPSAWGLAPAGRGRGAGVRWETGARAAPGPQGSGPCWQGIPRGAPGAQVKDGKGCEVEPFCFAGPALLAPPGSRATSAAAATTAAAGLARQSRSGAGARGEPGGGRGRGPSWLGISSARPRSRRHHFLLTRRRRRRRRRREPGPPARLPRPGRTFRVGRTKKKKFRRRGWRGRDPGGGDSARRRGSRAAAIASSSLSSAAPDGPARPRGSAFLSLPPALPNDPGQVGQRHAGGGACRAFHQPEARGVAGRPQPTQRPGAGRPPAGELCAVTAGHGETHTRTHSLRWLAFRRRGWSRTLSLRVRASVCGAPSPRILFPEAAQAAVGSKGTRV